MISIKLLEMSGKIMLVSKVSIKGDERIIFVSECILDTEVKGVSTDFSKRSSVYN